jgi:hypothetical protein
MAEVNPEAPREPGAENAAPITVTRADLVLLRRAVRSDWGVPDVARNEAIYQCLKILAKDGGRVRDKLAAAKTLAAFDRADVAAAMLALQTAKQAGPDLMTARDAWEETIGQIETETVAREPSGPPGGLPAPGTAP